MTTETLNEAIARVSQDYEERIKILNEARSELIRHYEKELEKSHGNIASLVVGLRLITIRLPDGEFKEFCKKACADTPGPCLCGMCENQAFDIKSWMKP